MCGTPTARYLLLCAIATVALGLLVASTASAAAPVGAPEAATACSTSLPYPGDSAEQEATAAWMAARARAAGLPGELPVMAGLVESGLVNLDDPRSGYAGFFQMSRDLFDAGEYEGFTDHPELQIDWFTDTARAVQARRVAAGKPDPAADETTWGEWIADVERPAAQYRYRYQLHLAEARELTGAGCSGPPIGDGDGDGPGLTLWGGTEQTLSRRVRVAVVCATACDASATGSLRIPGASTSYDLDPASGSATVTGSKVKLVLTLPRDAVRAGRKGLRQGERVRARIDVVVTDSTGAEASGRRNIRLR